MSQFQSILLVEDSPKDAELCHEGLAEHNLANAVQHVSDGVEALDYLHRRGPFASRANGLPVLILLDLKMPRMDGLELLRQLKSDATLRRIPVIVMTTSHEERDIVESQRLGAIAYVLKPVRFAEFLDSVAALGVGCALVEPLGQKESAAD